jgi:hypothetical protein
MIGCKVLFLLLLIAGILVSAGCISQPVAESRMSNLSMNITTSASAVKPVQTQCPIPKNSTLWIHINPVSNHYVGDVFEISGTTNLGSDDNLNITIIQSSFSRCPRIYSDCYRYTSIQSTIIVQDGNCERNNWTYSANLSGFKPERYIIDITDCNKSVKSSAVFDVLPAV